jgi:hypothetical protein
VARIKVRGRFQYQAFADGPDEDVARAMLEWCIRLGASPAHAGSPRPAYLSREEWMAFTMRKVMPRPRGRSSDRGTD